MKQTAVALATAILAGTAFGAYKQAAAPIKTAWGEKVTPENAWREYPRPQMVRANWTNLNGLWQYAVTKEVPGAPTKWDGEILVPFPIESALSGVGRLLNPDETLWYRRTFDAAAKPGERLLLHFEECDFRAQVFLNGVELDIPHEGGQVPFSYDVTDRVKKGANELVVSVWDPTTDSLGAVGKQSFKPHGCSYTRCSGIGGTVWLETVPATYLAGYRVTTDFDKGTASVKLNVAGESANAKGTVRILQGGKVVAERSVREMGAPITFALPEPRAAWSPESPNLYALELTVTDEAAKTADAVKGYFGLRKIEVKKDAQGVMRVWFNNEIRFLVATLDQGWWPDGLLTPPSDEAMAYDIKALKAMGFDMMRKHIKVEPRRYYYLCDTLGILVLQDMPSGGGNDQLRYGPYRRELKEMVDHLFNVPSVIGWVPYNEGWGEPGAFLTHCSLVWVKRYDPSRLVDGPSGWSDFEGGKAKRKGYPRYTRHPPPDQEEAGDLVDRHDYAELPGMYAPSDRRASFLGEWGGYGCRVPANLWTADSWSYGNTGNDTNRVEVQAKYLRGIDRVAELAVQGLAGCVYTQTTDVEQEINGLLTYDRKVMKYDPATLKAGHDKIRAAVRIATKPKNLRTVFARLATEPVWSYTFAEPAKDWTNADFDDGQWKKSAGGFGNPGITRAYAHAKVATAWNTKTLWVRRHFTLGDLPANLGAAVFDMFHDEDAEVYLNGRLILSKKGANNNWTFCLVDAKTFAAAAKKGDNVLAVKIVQTVGDQYFDTGLSLETE